jgi:hypothetical protein
MWYYRVRSTGEGGRSTWSNVESVGVVPQPPVLNPIYNPENDGIYVVSWSKSLGATVYTLQEDDNPDFATPTVRYSGQNTQKTITGQPGGTWYYRVRAGGTFGDGDWSNVEVTGVKPAAPYLWPVNNDDGDGAYLVDWTNPTGATGYRLEEDDNSDFSSPGERYSGPDSQYQVNNQQTGTWYYRVVASNPAGDSPWSTTRSVLVIYVVPDAPFLYEISNPDGNGEYLVDWSVVAGATDYRLEEDDNPGFSSATERYRGPDNLYQVSNQQPGTWYYRALASNPAGDSPWSNTGTVVVNLPPKYYLHLPLVLRSR